MKKFRIVLLILFLFFTADISAVHGKVLIPPDSKGYVGTLPELTREYDVKNEKTDTPIKAIPSKDFNSEGEIKPAPIDNPAFVNIILKTDKTSKYLNDVTEFISLLENIYDLIDDNESVQLFNAKVYYFSESVDYFKDKYADKPESAFISYKKLIQLSTHARSVALLRTEALKYNPYLSYENEGSIYNPNNIQEQLNYLKTEIKQTILVLREVK